MGDFYDDDVFPEEIDVRSSIGPEFYTEVVEFGVENVTESRNAVWPYPRNKYNIAKVIPDSATWNLVLDWFTVMRGRYTGFRVKDWSDYKSCRVDQTEAFDDQIIGAGDGTTLIFQVVKNRTLPNKTIAKSIKKTIAGTVAVGISNVSSGDIQLGTAATPIGWTVDDDTGLVTFDADITKSISTITQAAEADVTTTATHGLAIGDTVYFSGVVGMTQINGLRGTVTSLPTTSRFTVDINSTGFTAYSSAGTINTAPQSGESVLAGYQFHVPVRFDTDDLSGIRYISTIGALSIDSLPLIELFNP
jgi:uncharacterized protein (TIGR02217 family)